MNAEQYNINSAERALENVMHHEQYLLWYDSTPAGRARQHGNSQQKKTKLDEAHTNENMVENTSILPHQNACFRHPTLVSIKNSLPSDPYSNTNIASQQQQGISEVQNKAPAPADTRESTMAKTGFGLTAAVTPVTVRATCTKDRHSKVRTAKGLRDRRVRLPAPTAVRFFDVQDRLGYDQPSKAMDWLIQKAQAAIKDLAPVKPIALAFDKSSIELEMVIEEINRCKDPDEQCEKEDPQSNRGVTTSSPTSGALAISRVRARDRAKEKSNRGHTVPTEAKTSALPPRLTSPAVSMSPEILLSQFPQTISEPVVSHLIRPLQQSDFSSDAILPQSTTSPIMSPPTHFFHLPHKENAPFIFHDFPTPLSSATSSYYINNNTLISPRGTLQSIFIDSITSPVPVVQSNDMMGPHGGTCEVVGASINRSTGVPATPVDLCVPMSNRNEEFPKMHLTPL